MKKGLKILCAALSLTAIMSFSAFAAEAFSLYDKATTPAFWKPLRGTQRAMPSNDFILFP